MRRWTRPALYATASALLAIALNAGLDVLIDRDALWLAALLAVGGGTLFGMLVALTGAATLRAALQYRRRS